MFLDNLPHGIYGSGDESIADNIRIITLNEHPQTGKLRVRVLNGKEAFKGRVDFKMELR